MDLATNRALRISSLGLLLLGALWAAGCDSVEYPACETVEDCKQGEFCVNGLCQQCRTDQDCGPGKRCEAGACNAIPGYCTSSSDCPSGQDCENNMCVSRSSVVPTAPDTVATGGCALDPVYFDYDSSTLDQSSRDKLSAAAACIQQRGLKAVHLTGLTDPRGTEEYNLALGDRRAQAAKKYMEGLAIGASMSASSMGEELATGSDEATWSRDRRVDFQER
jgi:peptidoglycan-associated lipoprotein